MTTESKHSPGPWRATKLDADRWEIVQDSENGLIVAKCKAYRNQSPSEIESNAQILAAALCMYATLVTIIDGECDSDGECGCHEAARLARAAIAKVEGK